MLNRLFSFLFIIFILATPVAGLASLVSGPILSPQETMQKSMCLTTGVSCGAGHVLLPALSRM